MRRQYYRGRRRSGAVNPLVILVAVILLLAVVWLISGALHGDEETPAGPDTPSAGETTPAEPGQNGETVPEEEKEEPATESGISCTLTELGKNAVRTGDLILVNNQVHYQFPEEQPLVCIYEEKSSSYIVARTDIYLDPVAMDALDDMMNDFREQGGSKTVNVVAGYRTAEFQQHLFDQSAARNGLEHAQKYVAQPGGSEHHTGLVVDFSILNTDGTSQDFSGTGEYAWITEHCHEYGYVVRYEEGKELYTGIWDEPWHFRYLGPVHASEIRKQGMCLEEYIDFLKEFPFEEEHLTIECDEGTYEVWYCKGTKAWLPDSGEYTVSGNNVDGIIVTYKVD